jgi:HPt (histidine-containing phosphotransfer) domain-containing protein
MKQYTVVVDSELMDLIPDFLKHRKQEIEKSRGALNARDYPALARIGHNLKGVAGSFGFAELSRMGQQLQTLAKHEDTQALAHLIAQIADYLAALKVLYK